MQFFSKSHNFLCAHFRYRLVLKHCIAQCDLALALSRHLINALH